MEWTDVATTKEYIDAEPNVKSNIRAQYFKDFIKPRKDFPSWDEDASEAIRSSFVDEPKEEKPSITENIVKGITAVGDTLKRGRDFLDEVGATTVDYYEKKKFGPQGFQGDYIGKPGVPNPVPGAIKRTAGQFRDFALSAAVKTAGFNQLLVTSELSKQAVDAVSKIINKPLALTKSLMFFGKYRTVEEHMQVFKDPSSFPSTASIIRDNYKSRNLTRSFFGLPPVPEGDVPLSETEIKVGSEILGGIADAGLVHLAFVGAGTIAGVKKSYALKQSVPRNQMIDLAEAAAKKAGWSATDAKDLATSAMRQQWSKSSFFQKTPGNIRKGVKYMQENEDVMVQSYKQLREALQDFQGANATQADWMRKAGASSSYLTTPSVNLIEGVPATRPNTHFGKLLEAQMLEAEGVPLHPATAGKAGADKILKKIAEASPPARGLAQETSDPGTMFGNLIKAQILAKEAIPLHPSEAVHEGLQKLFPDYKGADLKSLKAEVFPDLKPGDTPEIITPIKEATYRKTISKYPGMVTDNASLTKVGNAMAKDMGIKVPIIWKYKTRMGTGMGGHHRNARGGQPDEIVVRIGPQEIFKGLMNKTGIGTRQTTFTPSQGRIKTLMLHELTHMTQPPLRSGIGKRNVHHTAFWDDLAKWKRGRTITTQKPVSSKIEITPPKLMSQMDEAKVVASPTELSPNVIPEMDDLYSVEYITASGVKEDMMSGAEVHKLAQGLRNGNSMMDAQGLPISKVRSFWSVWKKGHLNLMPFEDIITDIHGIAEKNLSKFSTFAKKIGTPFWIGQKYPAFKPVYNGVQNGVDYKTELFYEGAQILQPKTLGKLPASSKSKVSSVIRHGNTEGIEKWFSSEELTKDFGMNPEEIIAYNRIRKMYKFATDIEVKSRKTIGDYDKLKPEQQQSVDLRIRAQVERLGGYVSQSRSGGDWAVYSPPKVQGESADFFNLYKSKSEAQAAAKELGPNASFYLRNNISRDQIRNLTLADLENLIESADVSTGSSDIAALRDVLKSRTFSSHWIKRKNVPGFNWEFDSIVENAIDYMEGAASKLGRITGKKSAEAAFAKNVESMTPDIRTYARNFIDVSYNSGAVGYQLLNKVIYGYKLAFKLSWLAQNLTQPFATTYPLLSRYFKGFNLDAEKAFIGAYGQAMKYAIKKVSGKPHGLDPRLNYMLEKLHKQGVLGDQLTKFQLGVKKLSTTDVEKWMGLYGRIGEGINRSHAAIVGYKIATEKLGYTNKDVILNFMKEFVLKSQFPYGKQNLPQIITGAGNLKNVIRTMYTFKHFSASHLSMMNSVMPWRGGLPGEWTRALGALALQGGIKALPFAALFALGYKMLMGRTMDSDIRGALDEAEVPNAAIDMALHGMYSQVGVDASNLIGAGDVIPTFGSTVEKIGGPAVGLARQLGTAVWYASRGEHLRALENASPDAIRNVFKGARYATEGLRKANGELISTPSKKDSIMQGIGFTPMSVSKAWASREAIKTMVDNQRKRSSEFHQAIAKALNAKDKKKQMSIEAEVRRYNSRVPKEARVELKTDTINLWRDKIKGRDRTVPRQMRSKAKQLEKLYGVRRGLK